MHGFEPSSSESGHRIGICRQLYHRSYTASASSTTTHHLLSPSHHTASEYNRIGTSVKMMRLFSPDIKSFEHVEHSCWQSEPQEARRHKDLGRFWRDVVRFKRSR